jgi:hypothetical protein
MTPSTAERSAARLSLPPHLRKTVPVPEHDHVHALACEMAQAMIRGWLRGRQAYAALVLAAEKAPENATLLADAWQTLKNHYKWLEDRRQEVMHEIGRTIEPMIAEHRPKNAILAEAHGVNGTTGFFLTEPEVTNTATHFVWLSLPTRPYRGRGNAR